MHGDDGDHSSLFNIREPEADSYLLELARYIHLNPVRVGMENNPDNYPWSSHGCYLGRSNTPWLTIDWVLGQLDDDRARAQMQYGYFVQDDRGEGHRMEFHRGSFEGRVLGDDRFIEQALQRAEQSFSRPMTISGILDAVCDCYGVGIEDLAAPGKHQPLAEARAAAAWLVKQSDNLQLKELGEKLHRDLSGLSQAARRIEQRAMHEAGLRGKLQQLRERARNSVSQA